MPTGCWSKTGTGTGLSRVLQHSQPCPLLCSISSREKAPGETRVWQRGWAAGADSPAASFQEIPQPESLSARPQPRSCCQPICCQGSRWPPGSTRWHRPEPNAPRPGPDLRQGGICLLSNCLLPEQGSRPGRLELLPASLVVIIANSLFPCLDASLLHVGFCTGLKVPGLPWCTPLQDGKRLKSRDEDF